MALLWGQAGTESSSCNLITGLYLELQNGNFSGASLNACLLPTLCPAQGTSPGPSELPSPSLLHKKAVVQMQGNNLPRQKLKIIPESPTNLLFDQEANVLPNVSMETSGKPPPFL